MHPPSQVATVLIDTDVLIEVTRARDAKILEQWEELSASDAVVLCSAVTIAEMWHGARPSETKVLDALFGSLVCIPADAEIGRLAGRFLNRFHKSHSVELGDAIIGASAVAHAAKLWTRNRKHYPMSEISFW